MAQSTFIKKKPKMYTFNVKNLKRISMPGMGYILLNCSPKGSYRILQISQAIDKPIGYPL